MEIVVIFGRMLFSSLSNVYQKKLSHQGLHPFYIVATTYFVLTLFALPSLHMVEVSALPDEFWGNVFLASILDVAGWLFMVMSLSKTDLSVFGPLNAYKTVISMILAVLFLEEIPNFQGFCGVLVIIAGSFFLSPGAGIPKIDAMLQLLRDKGVQARFISILLFSVGTVFLKNSVIYAGAFDTVVFWSLLGLPLVLLANAWFLPGDFMHSVKQSGDHLQTIVVTGVLVFAMQYLTLVLLSQMLVAYTMALFQLGMLLQVFLGYKIFNEKHFLRRMSAGLVMMAGSILVLMA